MANAVVSAPSMTPPAAANAEKQVAGLWVGDKRITALWSINQNRNAWVYVAGVGWKRLASNSDSAIVALNMLASHARALNCRVDYREEADGMIREMYVA